MSATNRAKLIGKLYTALKKHYSPIVPDSRPLLEHVLYGSLLEGATYELADEGMAKCEQDFFDWNEVRVTTVTELAQVLSNFPDPTKAAQRLKGNLQDIFEEFYTFDLDHLRKENLGKAVNKFEKMPNMTPFVLAYAVQNGLGGHSIPVDYAGLVVMLSTEIISQSEASDSRVPGLERAIAKNKGVEFGSLLHQCAVALLLDPSDKTGRAVLDATSKKSSDRLDEWLASKTAAKKRVRKRKAAEKEAEKVAAQEELEAAKAAAGKKTATKTASKKSSGKPAAAGAKTAPAKKSPVSEKKAPVKPKASDSKTSGKAPAKKTAATKKPATTKKSPAKKAPVKKATASKPAEKKSTTKKATAKKSASKKAASKKSTPKKATAKKASAKKTASKKSPTKKASSKKTDNRKLTKKKPR